MEPANPRLNRSARKVLEFLYAIKGTYTIAGQHNYITTPTTYTQRVSADIGKTPLIWGSDFSFFADDPAPTTGHYHCGPLNISDPGETPQILNVTIEQMRHALVKAAVEQHRAGHIVTLMWHCTLPPYADRGPYSSVWTMDKRPDMATWKALMTEGTELHTQWIKQTDAIAEYLGVLRDQGVPVLWRPYHEMNGVWFWWCNKKGPEGFSALWRMMFDRFVHVHRLDNLIWVWNANAPRDRPGDEAYAYADFYPGGQYVDVLAADVYRADYRQSHHDDLAVLADGRPIALGEVGTLPTPEILASQPLWSWFMPWGALVFWNDNTPERRRALYLSPRVLALEDVRRRADGSFEVCR